MLRPHQFADLVLKGAVAILLLALLVGLTHLLEFFLGFDVLPLFRAHL